MNDFIERLGWVLLHSLWQFALVALLASALVQAMRRSSSAARYGLLVVAMAVMVVVPLATRLLLSNESRDKLASRAALAPGQDPNVVTTPGADAVRLANNPILASESEVPSPDHAESSVASEAPATVSPLTPVVIPSAPSWSERAKTVLRPWLAWIVIGWSFGVVVCSLRPLLGWHMLWRLKRVGVLPVSDDVLVLLRRVSERLGLRRAVRVWQSTLARVPVVIGYFRPVILLPVSLMTSLPAEQLEAILAHELAHVRRHDFVVNLLQTLVETFFFYHPAVWWLSRQIRVEREHCCDDLVVASLGNRVEYGRALLAIEELHGQSTVLALGAADGSLLSRVRRIVGFHSDQAASSMSSMLGLVICCFGAIVGLSALGWHGMADENLDENSAAKSDPARQYVAEFPSGARVEFVGMTRNLAKSREGWKPNGEPIVDVADWPRSAMLRGNSQHWLENMLLEGDGTPADDAVDLLLRFENVKSQPSLKLQLPSSYYIYITEHLEKPHVLRVPCRLDKKREPSKVRIGLTDEPWGIPQQVGSNGELLNKLNESSPYWASYQQVKFWFHSPPHEPEKVQFAIQWPEGEVAVQTRVVDKNGKGDWADGHRKSGSRLHFVNSWGEAPAKAKHDGSAGMRYDLHRDQVARFEYRLRPYRHWVTFDNVALNPGEMTDVKVSTESIAASNPAGGAKDGNAEAEITPAQIAEQIEAMTRRFESVEYAATILETKNANAGFADKEPIPVSGKGSFRFLSDGERWLADEHDFWPRSGESVSFPYDSYSGFDGDQHFHFSERGLMLGQHDFANTRLGPRDVFWHGGQSAGWLLNAIKDFNARVVRREMIAGYECVVIGSEPGKPKPGETNDRAFQPQNWRYEITLSPKQSWLPLKTEIQLDSKRFASERLENLVQTPQGIWYPQTIRFQAFTTTYTNTMAKQTRITAFRLRDKFDASEFRRATPLPVGVDIVDYRRSQVWHNDPWWSDLAPWLATQLAWPPPNLSGLSDLRSHGDKKFHGQLAPPIEAAEWLNGNPGPWDRTGRKLSILFFFGGDAVDPTPKWLAGLKGLHDRYAAAGLDVIGVAPSTIDPAIIRRTVKSIDVRFPVAIDAQHSDNKSPGRTYAAFGMSGVVLIDAAGRVIVIDPEDRPAGVKVSPIEYLIRQQLSQTGRADDEPELSADGFRQVEAEWKRLRKLHRPNNPAEWRLQAVLRFPGDKPPEDGQTAKLEIVPEFRLLLSNTPGGYLSMHDAPMPIVSDEGCDLVGLPKGTYRVTVTRPGFASVDRHVVLPIADPAKPLEIAMLPGDTIRGQVVDAAGNAIEGAKIRATKRHFDSKAPKRYTTGRLSRDPRTSDENGQFAFDQLFEGSYTLEITADGFQPLTSDPIPVGKRDVKIVLPKPGDAIKKTEETRAGRGSPDPALNSTAGLPNSDDEKNPTNNTNGDLRSKPTAGSGDPRRAQDLTPRESTNLEPINGEVIDAATGKPIEGATVRFRFGKLQDGLRSKALAELVFRDVGRFTFELPDAVKGQKDLFVERTAEHPDYQTSAPGAVPLHLLFNKNPNHAHDFIRKVELVPGQIITGQVLDLNGRPAKGVEVFSGKNRQGWGNGNVHRTTTDANGRYRLAVPNRERGRVYVIPNHAAAVSRAITSEFGEQPVFQLLRGTRLFGRVTDAQGRGVADVVVRANGGERVPWRYAMTDADGKYSLPPCQYGTYTVELMDEGWMPDTTKRGVRLSDVFVTQKVELPKTAPTQRQLDFKPADSVRVTARFTTADDQPVSGRTGEKAGEKVSGTIV